MIMDNDLQYLVHFFNDKKYLFKTITMSGVSEMEAICNTVTTEKGWFWPRFAPSERRAYLARRLFVEKEMYEDYTCRYGSLKEKIPVYFYLYPNLTVQRAREMGQQRAALGEAEPHVLVIKIQDIEDIGNITFTLNDSFASFWKRAVEAGLEIRGDKGNHVVLPEHNQVFPFSLIEEIHQKYKEQKISYEIQVWDRQLLDNLKYEIIGE